MIFSFNKNSVYEDISISNLILLTRNAFSSFRKQIINRVILFFDIVVLYLAYL